MRWLFTVLTETPSKAEIASMAPGLSCDWTMARLTAHRSSPGDRRHISFELINLAWCQVARSDPPSKGKTHAQLHPRGSCSDRTGERDDAFERDDHRPRPSRPARRARPSRSTHRPGSPDSPRGPRPPPL